MQVLGILFGITWIQICMLALPPRLPFSKPHASNTLNHEPLDLILQTPNLPHQITRLISRDTRRDNCPANTTSSSQRRFGRYIDVRNTIIALAAVANSATIMKEL